MAMFAWLKADATRRFAKWFLGAALISLWTGFLVPTIWLWNTKFLIFPSLDEISNWLLLVLCVTGLMLVLRQTIGGLFRKDA